MADVPAGPAKWECGWFKAIHPHAKLRHRGASALGHLCLSQGQLLTMGLIMLFSLFKTALPARADAPQGRTLPSSPSNLTPPHWGCCPTHRRTNSLENSRQALQSSGSASHRCCHPFCPPGKSHSPVKTQLQGLFAERPFLIDPGKCSVYDAKWKMHNIKLCLQYEFIYKCVCTDVYTNTYTGRKHIKLSTIQLSPNGSIRDDFNFLLYFFNLSMINVFYY